MMAQFIPYMKCASYKASIASVNGETLSHVTWFDD